MTCFPCFPWAFAFVGVFPHFLISCNCPDTPFGTNRQKPIVFCTYRPIILYSGGWLLGIHRIALPFEQRRLTQHTPLHSLSAPSHFSRLSGSIQLIDRFSAPHLIARPPTKIISLAFPTDPFLGYWLGTSATDCETPSQNSIWLLITLDLLVSAHLHPFSHSLTFRTVIHCGPPTIFSWSRPNIQFKSDINRFPAHPRPALHIRTDFRHAQSIVEAVSGSCDC